MFWFNCLKVARPDWCGFGIIPPSKFDETMDVLCAVVACDWFKSMKEPYSCLTAALKLLLLFMNYGIPLNWLFELF